MLIIKNTPCLSLLPVPIFSSPKYPLLAHLLLLELHPVSVHSKCPLESSHLPCSSSGPLYSHIPGSLHYHFGNPLCLSPLLVLLFLGLYSFLFPGFPPIVLLGNILQLLLRKKCIFLSMYIHENVSFQPSHLIVGLGIEFRVESHFLADREVIDKCLPEPSIAVKKCDALLILDPLYMS